MSSDAGGLARRSGRSGCEKACHAAAPRIGLLDSARPGGGRDDVPGAGAARVGDDGGLRLPLCDAAHSQASNLQPRRPGPRRRRRPRREPASSSEQPAASTSCAAPAAHTAAPSRRSTLRFSARVWVDSWSRARLERGRLPDYLTAGHSPAGTGSLPIAPHHGQRWHHVPQAIARTTHSTAQSFQDDG